MKPQTLLAECRCPVKHSPVRRRSGSRHEAWVTVVTHDEDCMLIVLQVPVTDTLADTVADILRRYR